MLKLPQKLLQGIDAERLVTFSSHKKVNQLFMLLKILTIDSKIIEGAFISEFMDPGMAQFFTAVTHEMKILAEIK
jgi:hypothetical protein